MGNYSSISTVVSVVLLLLLLNNGFRAAAINDTCPDDVSPCECYIDEYEGLTIKCFVKDTLADIKATFSSMTPPIEIAAMGISFDANYSDFFIPEDLLGESYIINKLYLGGSFLNMPNVFTLVKMDPNSFRSSQVTLNILYMHNVDTTHLDFQFLAGFQNFSALQCSGCLNLDRSLRTLPPLPTFSSIEFRDSTGLNKVAFNNMPALKTNGLVKFSIEDSYLDEDSVAQLMDWILPSSSQSLKELTFTYHRMRSSPIQIGSFKNLEYVQLYYNKADNMTLTSNSFYAPGPPAITNFNLRENNIVDIEPGTFQGNYSSTTKIDLYEHDLTRFEEAVFKSVLQDMKISSSFLNTPGTINVKRGLFDCYSDPCHLAWLLRDNRDLLSHIEQAYCSSANGPSSSFADLSPDLFTDCP